MTRSPDNNPRRAEGPTETPTLVAVHALAGQRLPLRVTTCRALAVVACEALPAADRLLAREGARLAVKPTLAELAQGVTS